VEMITANESRAKIIIPQVNLCYQPIS